MAHSISGLGKIQNKSFDIPVSKTVDGTPIIIWASHDGINQKWSLTSKNEIESALDQSKCIDLLGGVVEIGTPVILNKKNGSDSQKWKMDAEGRIVSLLYPNRCISAGGAVLDNRIKDGYELVLWNVFDSSDQGQKWKMDLNTAAIPTINLSYKILMNPVTGQFPTDFASGEPRQGMVESITSSIKEMNDLCVTLNASFRFKLYEPPVLIGGPNASGHVNFWYNTRIMSHEQMISFNNNAKLLFDKNNPNDQSNAFGWRAKAVNIYLTGYGYGGVSTIPEHGELTVLCIDADRIGVPVQFHELGHYFGLRHTFDDKGDDPLADTLLDIGDINSTRDDIIQLNFKGRDLRQSPLTARENKQVDDVWNNIMSYHGTHTLNVLTQGQLKRWDSIMRNQRSEVLT